VLQGRLDPSWQPLFGELEVRWDAHHNTVLEGFVADQAALHGLLARVRDLGVPLVAVRRLRRRRG
jgi:hypothetical protein